jgi:hypothetical protein
VIDGATGQIHGTPSAGDVGSDSGITVSVTDGTTTVSLGPFSITVNAVANGSATITWTAPSMNTDGTTLSDLAGYRIVYGTAAGALNQLIEIPGTGLSAYTVDNLAPGTWFFSVKAYSAGGSESVPSNPVSTTIP